MASRASRVRLIASHARKTHAGQLAPLMRIGKDGHVIGSRGCDSQHFSQVSVGYAVAQALMPAASPLMVTLFIQQGVGPARRVETSLDTAGTSACATAADGW